MLTSRGNAMAGFGRWGLGRTCAMRTCCAPSFLHLALRRRCRFLREERFDGAGGERVRRWRTEARSGMEVGSVLLRSLCAHERRCAYLPQMVTEVATVAKSGFAVVLCDTSAPSRAHRAMRVAASDLGRPYSAAQSQGIAANIHRRQP